MTSLIYAEVYIIAISLIRKHPATATEAPSSRSSVATVMMMSQHSNDNDDNNDDDDNINNDDDDNNRHNGRSTRKKTDGKKDQPWTVYRDGDEAASDSREEQTVPAPILDITRGRATMNQI